MIPQDFIDRLLDRVDIVEVIDRQVPLKKAGQNYVACCPFHREKSPSFSVSPQKQFYHCFGCGAHGNALTFLMEHHGMGFVDAVHALAEQVGMAVPQPESTPAQHAAVARQYSLQDCLLQAARFYKYQLKHSPTAIDYLKRRGLTGETAARFAIGYAPSGWNALQGVFEDYLNPQLVEAGLLVKREDGSRYDRFRERIMFPIRNRKGQIIAFGGRVLGQGEPKYLNSPETPLFEKGRELYGLFEARQAIREHNCVLVVEGYMDVVMLAQHGIDYVVATLGTSTTPHHIHSLLRQTDHIVFCFDGDAAGKKAAWRALESSLSQLRDGKRVSFLFLPAEHDPDSYVRAHGQAGFEAYLQQQAVPLSAYLLQALLQQQGEHRSEEGRAALVQQAMPLLKAIAAPALATLLRQRFAEQIGMPVAELERLLGIKRPWVGRKGQFSAQPAPQITYSLPQRVLRWLVLYPTLAHRVPVEELAWQEATEDVQQCIALSTLIQSLPHCTTTGQLIQGLQQHPLAQPVLAVLHTLRPESDPEQHELESEFDAAITALLSRSAQQRLEHLKRKDRESGLSREEQYEMVRLSIEVQGKR